MHDRSMASTFGWIAIDPTQRKQMLETVELFRDKGTVDDLGIGAIRDAISDTLFPGTSTLHTRLRYVLFVPWLLEEASNHDSVKEMSWAFHDLERDFIDVLKAGMGQTAEGIVGRRAGKSVQRVPSVIYWGMMLTWGIVESGLSTQDYFRRHALRLEQLRNAPAREENEPPLELIPTGIEPNLPPAPSKLLRDATFSLRHEEAAYLSEQISQTCAGSLLVHLLHHAPDSWKESHSAPEHLWSPEVIETLTPELQSTVDLAERFSLIIQGANLLYNLLLAEATSSRGQERFHDDRVEYFRNEMTEWAFQAREMRPLEAAEHTAIGSLMAVRRRTFTKQTQDFLASWFEAALDPLAIADSDAARQLVRRRELAVKRQRARLRPGNWKALDAWSGASGTSRFEYRWAYARRHLQDIFDGLERA